MSLSERRRRGESLPTRGAWIETRPLPPNLLSVTRRSPRGERGLKQGRSPSSAWARPSLPTRGAWIETPGLAASARGLRGRSPRGERGLKPCQRRVRHRASWVAPHGFNPRSPRGERPRNPRAEAAKPGVSIHAPRVGSDPRRSMPHAPLAWFQSTLPAWGATPPERVGRSGVSGSVD